MRPWILALQLLLATAVAAQDHAPAAPAADSLLTRTRTALQELTNLEATTTADREAFRQSETDLERTLAEYQKPLPDVPPALELVPQLEEKEMLAKMAEAQAYHKAWDLRQSRYRRASETIAQLEKLRGTLRSSHEVLLDRAVDLRPVLIEAQRRIDRRELKDEDLQLEDSSSTVADWITRSEDLAANGDALLEEVDELIARLARVRKRFEELPPDYPRTIRTAQRIETSLKTLAEAKAVADEQRAILEKAPSETVPSEITRAVVEWKARLGAVDTAAASVTTEEEKLGAVIAKQETQVAPRREDVPPGEGFKEIRDARQDVGLATRMISYLERSLELLRKANAERETLLKVFEDISKRHVEFTRQSARMLAFLKHAGRLSEDGTLEGWNEPPDASEKIVWNEWRRRQIAELDRFERAERIRAGLVAAKDIEAVEAKLAAERESLTRAETRLATEVSYAEFVAKMEDQSGEQLLALLAPDGEIVRKLAALATANSEIEKRIAQATAKGFEAVRAIQTVENPYSQAAIRKYADSLSKIRQDLESLEEGKPYPDESSQLAPEEKPVSFSLTDSREVEKRRLTAEKLADEESRYLAREQQFAREFLGYFVSLQESLATLSTAVEERRSADAQHETQLDEVIREEKRRYAAAIQIRRRLADGRLEASKAPKNLDSWLGRAPIVQATQALRTARLESGSLLGRATYEIDRVQNLTAGTQWIRIRSESADTRVRLSGRPVAHLTAALTTLDKLSEVERQHLVYEAKAMESDEDSMLEGLLARFTDSLERQRFEDPLATYYLELADARRVTKNLREAKRAYEQMAENCIEEKEKLLPLRDQFDKSVALRLADYHAARYAAAVVAHPVTRSRLEESFRKEYGQELPYRLNFDEENRNLVAELLFGAQARLVAERSLARDAARLLSKIGLDQESSWYGSQTARMGTMLQLQKSREGDLRQRITELRATYDNHLEDNAVRGLSATLVIPMVAFLIVRLLRRFSRRFEARVMLKQDEEYSDRQRRLQTVSKTSTAAIAVLVWTVAIVYVFARLGLDITPIVASASVVGLAVAFGAQTLIKDFFSGFFILIENQFTIGDVVTLGTITGTVENISLRITVLRDLKGIVHYIPNGSIGQVSNQTQGWSRVVMEISVAYKEDPDQVSRILGDVLLEMARDEAWSREIIEDPVVAGVEMLTERSVDIRVMIKTRPGQQWAVAREARRRIKMRFDELGIEIPFPHRVVHHVYEGSDRAASDGPQSERGEREESASG